METLTQQFQSRVTGFLERTGLKPSMFGLRAAGDPNLMRQLRRGRSPTLKLADQVLAFMDSHDQAHGDRASSRSRPLGDASLSRHERQSGDQVERTGNGRARPPHSAPEHSSPHGAVAEHDLPASGRRELPRAGVCRRLGGGGRGCLDPPTERATPWRRSVTGAGTSFWIDAVHERQAQFTGPVSLAVARETVCLARCSRPPKGPPGSRRYASL